ncbi:MAG: hypothetical protein K5881_04635 [Saccharofermentans sp.]|nr:hypothetical protein [Saccharofermentans sp.]
MKKILIRLTGLIVTLSIVLSTGGIALATETEDQDNGTDVAATEPAEIPDTVEPAPVKEEEPAPAAKPAAEEPAEEKPAANEPAEEPAKEEEPAEKPAAEEPAAPAKADASAKEGTNKRSITKTIKVDLDKSNDELAEGYINSVFSKKSSLTKRSVNYEAQFENNQISLSLYRYLRSQISKIASGEISSTVITCDAISYTAEDLGLENLNDSEAALNAGFARLEEDLDFDLIFHTLLQSSPYDFYWFDKTAEGACSLSYSYSYPFFDTVDFQLTFSFIVASEYQANGDSYTVKSTYGSSVITARDNAMAIVTQNASLDDYNKLKAYRDEICDLTEYNKPASQGGVAYGNPWQMIWVFDGNPSTTVVCEGYSKAFQFLCDNSTFQNDVYAYTVTGTMDDGRHMWNVVHMEDGQNYLVDVTNCDSLGRDVLFLRGKTSNLSGKPGYIISVSLYDISEIEYAYDTDGTYPTPDIATSDYVYNPGPTPVTEPAFAASHGMVLSGEIGVRFIVDFPENYDTTGCYVDFAISSGRTASINYSDSLVNPNNASQRYFIFYVNPLELADTITATLHYGDNQTAEDTYSAMAYIKYVQTNLKEDPAWADTYVLVNNLQDYGYYMQQSGWSDGYTHTPITAPVKTLGSADMNAANEALANFSISKALGNSGIEDSVNVGLSIASQTELRVSVKPGSGVTITSTNCIPRTINNEQYYQFSRKNIGPKALGNNMAFTIVTDQGTATVNVSVMYYVRVALASTSFTEAQKYALVAYYNYYVSAMAYGN